MSETQEFLAVAIVLIPLVVMWVLALFNITVRRHDLSIGWKGIWSATVILIPYIGVLLYVIVRPPAQPKAPGRSGPTAADQAIDQIHHAIAEHDSGSITNEEFAAQKADVFGIGEPAT
ncbi:MAG: hypothetical protein U9R47_07975 [Actinomycetota bacterium]|nr:hypothetical protein [Actinomycetota bacterium]